MTLHEWFGLGITIMFAVGLLTGLVLYLSLIWQSITRGDHVSLTVLSLMLIAGVLVIGLVLTK